MVLRVGGAGDDERPLDELLPEPLPMIPLMNELLWYHLNRENSIYMTINVIP